MLFLCVCWCVGFVVRMWLRGVCGWGEGRVVVCDAMMGGVVPRGVGGLIGGARWGALRWGMG